MIHGMASFTFRENLLSEAGSDQHTSGKRQFVFQTQTIVKRK